MFNPPTLLIAYGLAKMQEKHVLSTRKFRTSNLNFLVHKNLGEGIAVNNKGLVAKNLSYLFKNFPSSNGGKEEEGVML